MKHLLTLEQFAQNPDGLSSLNESATIDNVQDDAVFGKAAMLIGSLINRKTNKDYKMYPFFVYYNEGSGDSRSVLFVSNTDGSAIRVSQGRSMGSGIIGSLDYFKNYGSDTADISISSDNFPIVKLIGEFVTLITDNKYEKSISESVIFEAQSRDLTSAEKAEVESRLSRGEAAVKISQDLGVSYGMILKLKRDVKMPESKKSPMVEKNTLTLGDKVKYMDEQLEDVYEISRRVAAGAFNSLFISGRAGTGKTYKVESALKTEGLVEDQDYFKVSGTISVLQMYKKLYQYSDKLLVFDDCDSVFKDESGRNILKAALDTKKFRRLSYLKKLSMLFDPKDYENDEEGYAAQIEEGNVPSYFEFTGQVIFISNMKKDQADPDGAIRSRSILIDINPDDATIMERMKQLLPYLEPINMPLSEKEEIYEFMKDSKDVSMRTFVKAAGFKMSGLKEWKRMAQRYV
jgi:hypothetical protein